MFVCNIKVNFKVVFVILCIIIVIILGLASFLVFKKGNFSNTTKINDNISSSLPTEITNKNYTNILKMVYDNINQYQGQEVKCIGYVYRNQDFSKDQFVIARNMLFTSEKDTMIVGFLCSFFGAENYPNGTWVEITATIGKTNYHGEIPVLKVKTLKETEKPSDEFVYSPDDSYIPTSIISYQTLL